MMKRSTKLRLIRPFVEKLSTNSDVTILTFHGIAQSNFEKFSHLIIQLKNQFNFIQPGELFEGSSKVSGKQNILITFDDGYECQKQVIEQVLDPLAIKSLLFVCNDFLDLRGEKAKNFVAKHFFPKSSLNERLLFASDAMTHGDLRRLISNGHFVAAHTFSHPQLSSIEDEKLLYKEIILAADELEENVGTKIDAFAFPFGGHLSINKRALEICSKRFRFIFSNIRGSNKIFPRQRIYFRQNINFEDPYWVTNLFVEGKFDWKYSYQRYVLNRMYDEAQKAQ